MKKLLNTLVMGMSLAVVSSLAFAYEDPLVGKWKTIDDQSGYSRADVEIRKKADGSYEGIIGAPRRLPGAEKMGLCPECPDQLQTMPFLGLPFIWDFKADPKKPREYHDGKVLDPISGKVYKGKARLSTNGKRLTLRGYVGVSVIGRSVTWVKY